MWNWWWASAWRCSSRAGSRRRRYLLAAVLAPYAVSEVSAAVIWRFLFDADVGPVTVALQAVGLPTLEWSVVPAHGLLIVALLSIWLHLPFTFIILYAARLAIPTQLYEAARVDAVSALQTFRYITLPLLMPAILVAMLFRYIFAFRLFSEVWLMTQGGPARSTEVLAVYLYLDAFRFSAFGSAAATGWLMVADIAAAGRRLPVGPAPADDERCGAKRVAVGVGKAAAVAVILLWSLVPIAFILVSSFKPSADIFAVPPRLTFAPTVKHFVDLWAQLERLLHGPAQQRHRHRRRHAARRRREHHGRLCLLALSQPRTWPAPRSFSLRSACCRRS